MIFPTTVDSVEDWLTQINLAKYAPSFASAGILQVAELPLLSDERLKQAGVTMVGHRKRLLQAAKELHIASAGGGSVFPAGSAMAQEAPAGSGSAEPMDTEGPAPPQQAAQRPKKRSKQRENHFATLQQTAGVTFSTCRLTVFWEPPT